MMLFDYLFIKLLTIKIYERVYWAKIFITCIEIIALEPTINAISKFYFGCKSPEISFYVLALLLLFFNSIYYSPDRIKKLKERYREESFSKRNIKFLLIAASLTMIFVFLDELVKLFIEIPNCN